MESVVDRVAPPQRVMVVDEVAGEIDTVDRRPLVHLTVLVLKIPSEFCSFSQIQKTRIPITGIFQKNSKMKNSEIFRNLCGIFFEWDPKFPFQD